MSVKAPATTSTSRRPYLHMELAWCQVILNLGPGLGHSALVPVQPQPGQGLPIWVRGCL